MTAGLGQIKTKLFKTNKQNKEQLGVFFSLSIPDIKKVTKHYLQQTFQSEHHIHSEYKLPK